MTVASPEHRAPRASSAGYPDQQGPARDSWGGWVLVLLLCGSLGYPVAGRLVDGAHLVADSMGHMTIVTDGRTNTLVGVGFYVAAVAAGCVAAIAPSSARRFGSAPSFFLQLLVLWWVILSVLIPRKDDLGLADLLMVGAIPLVIGVVSAPPTMTSVRRLNLIRDVFAVGQFIYPFLAPEVSRLPCREDKCGIFGHLDAGFFTQENTGIAAISLLLPLAGASSPRRLAFSSTMTILVALASGSRTGILSAAVATVIAVYVYTRLKGNRERTRISVLLLLAPIAATLASLALVLFADPTALTGRGAVYAANVRALDGPALLYGVPWNTIEVASEGYLIGDHGQTSHILARAGLIGFLLWVAAVVAPLHRRAYGPEQLLGLSVLGAGAARMMTESTFELDARTTGFLALLIVAGLCAHRPDGSGEVIAQPSRQGLALTGAVAAVWAVVIGVVPAFMPTTYTASTVIAVTVPASDAFSAETSRLARLRAAASVAGAGDGLREASVAASGLTADEVDATMSIRRREQAGYATLATTSKDPQQAATINDVGAQLLRRGLSTRAQRPQDASVEVRPLGPSRVERINPWKHHLPLLTGAATIATALVLVLDHGRRRRRLGG